MEKYTIKEMKTLIESVYHYLHVDASNYLELPYQLRQDGFNIRPLLYLMNKLQLDLDKKLQPDQEFGEKYFDFVLEINDMVEAQWEKNFKVLQMKRLEEVKEWLKEHPLPKDEKGRPQPHLETLEQQHHLDEMVDLMNDIANV